MYILKARVSSTSVTEYKIPIFNPIGFCVIFWILWMKEFNIVFHVIYYTHLLFKSLLVLSIINSFKFVANNGGIKDTFTLHLFYISNQLINNKLWDVELRGKFLGSASYKSWNYRQHCWFYENSRGVILSYILYLYQQFYTFFFFR